MKKAIYTEKKSRKLALAKYGLQALVFVLLFFMVNTAFGQTNLALNKTAVASSTQNASFPANLAVDGSTASSSRWASVFNSDNEWIYIDLANTYSINRVVLKWEAAYGKSYKIQVSSNASSWTDIYSTTTGNGATDDLVLTGTGRYVRMSATQRGTTFGYSMYEFEIYGTLVDTQAPTAPTALSSSSVTTSAFTLSWTASTDNVGVTSYDVFKDGTLYTNVTSTTANISGLSASTTYVMTVKAKDAAGNVSVASATMNVTTQSAGGSTNIAYNKTATASSTNVANPTSLALDENLSTAWSASSSAVPQWFMVDLAGLYTISSTEIYWQYTDRNYKYKIEVSGNGSSWTTVIDKSVNGATGNQTDNFTANGVRYVRMTCNATTNWAWVSMNEFKVMGSGSTDTQAPSVPTGLASSNITASAFTLSWTASTDNVGVTAYEVFRNGVSIGTTSTTSINVSGLSSATTYAMTVKAKDAAGNISATSSALNVTTTTIVDTQAPSVPTGLASSNITASAFTFSWTASTDNVGVTSYDVFKNGIFYTNVSSTSANISGLTASTTYSMTVKAKDAANNLSGSSSALNVTTIAQPNSKYSIGININACSRFTAPVFADAMMTRYAVNTTNVDTYGWPLQDATISIWLFDNAFKSPHTGTYHFSYTGSGNVSFNVGTVQNKSYNASTNKTSGDLILTTKPTFLSVTFTSTTGGIKNMKLMRPTYDGSSVAHSESEVFEREYVAALTQFSILRYMDFNVANGNTHVTWAQRVRPNEAQASGSVDGLSYGWQGRGASWEYSIILANTTQTNPWICVPAHADEAYYVKLAQLFKYGSDGVNPYTSPQANPVFPPLDSNLKLYVEYSNETWNSGFEVYSWLIDVALPAVLAAGNTPINYDGVASSNKFVGGFRLSAYKGVQISKAFRQVWGDAAMMTTVRPIFTWQVTNNEVYGNSDGFKFVDDYYGEVRADNPIARTPNYFFYGAGGAPYYEPSSTADINTIWDSNNFNLNTWKKPEFDVKYASAFGLKNVHYEGGPGLANILGGGGQIPLAEQAWLDPRMVNEVVEHQEKIQRLGTETATYLALYTGAGDWGFSYNQYDLSAPKWQALEQLWNSTPVDFNFGKQVPVSINGGDFDWHIVSWKVPTPTSTNQELKSGESMAYNIQTETTSTYYVNIEYKTTSAAALRLYDTKGNVIDNIALPNTSNTVSSTSSYSFTLEGNKLSAIRIKNTGSTSIFISKVIIGTIAKSATVATETTAVSNVNATEQISVYPNPATDHLKVNLPENVSKIEVFDISGHKLKTQVTPSTTENVDVTSLSQGIYVLRVVFDNGNVVNKRFVKR